MNDKKKCLCTLEIVVVLVKMHAFHVTLLCGMLQYFIEIYVLWRGVGFYFYIFSFLS